MLTVFYLKLTDLLREKTDFSFFRSRVSERTLQEAASFRSEKVRLTRLAGETLLRFGLEKLFGLDRKRYEICRSIHGKPYLKEEISCYFNISHSGDYVVCVFSDTEVGADIEKKANPRMSVARRFFHPAELEMLESRPEEQGERFYDLWTVKESFLKYTGQGLTRPLSSFRVEIRKKGEAVLYEGERRLPLFLRECRVDEAYMCYVCSRQNVVPLSTEISWENL